MKLSYFTMPLHPPARDYTETLHEDRAETITSGLVFLASLAYQTHRITLGSGTVNLPRWR